MSVFGRLVRPHLLRLSLVVAAAALAWTGLTLISGGGFDVQLPGLRLRSHDPLKPLLAAALALSGWILGAGDAASIVTRWMSSAWRALFQRAAVIGGLRWVYVAWALAAVTFLACLTHGTRSVGGSDSYGYMSEADRWLGGQLPVDQSFALQTPWPDGQERFTPFAWTVWARDARYIVPTVAPGLPWLLAAAKLIGGHAAAFWVVPLGAGGLVIATFFLIRLLAGETAAVIATWLTATSPIVLFISMDTMTDVPNAALWTAAFAVVLGRRRHSEVAAGLISSLAVMIRPNLAPLVALLAFEIFRHERGWTRAWPAIRRVSWYALGVLPGATVLFVFNAFIFGTPVAHGSASIETFSWGHVLPNLITYVRSMLDTQTPLALVGVFAIFVPLRRLWPSADRGVFIAIGLFVVAVWLLYFTFEILPAWWYLRYMIPTWPFIIGGLAAVVAALMRTSTRWAAALACGVVALGFLQLHLADERMVWRIGRGSARFVVAAQLARRLTVENSVVLCGQHVGSVRYYGGRMTMRVHEIDPAWFDRTVDWLTGRGVHVYMLLEDWEVPMVRTRFAGTRHIGALDDTPIADYRDPEELFIYDVSGPRPAGPSVMATGVETGAGFGAVPPVPLHPLVFK